MSGSAPASDCCISTQGRPDHLSGLQGVPPYPTAPQPVQDRRQKCAGWFVVQPLFLNQSHCLRDLITRHHDEPELKRLNKKMAHKDLIAMSSTLPQSRSPSSTRRLPSIALPATDVSFFRARHRKIHPVEIYSIWRVRRNRISFTSTSSGWLIGNATACADDSAGMAISE